jgi:hypothetical protein
MYGKHSVVYGELLRREEQLVEGLKDAIAGQHLGINYNVAKISVVTSKISD